MDFRSRRADCGSDSEPETTPLDEQEEEGLLPNSPVNANAGYSEEVGIWYFTNFSRIDLAKPRT